METKLEQIAVKPVNQLSKSVVREIRTPRSVGARGRAIASGDPVGEEKSSSLPRPLARCIFTTAKLLYVGVAPVGYTEVMDQRPWASDSIQACAIGARCPVEAVISVNWVRERSISHSSIDVLTAVLPRPGSSRSRMTTSSPWQLRRSAMSDPVIPPPTINASHLIFSPTSAVAYQGERPPRKSACSVSSESRTLITNLKLVTNGPSQPQQRRGRRR
jgi:hypothetical protein